MSPIKLQLNKRTRLGESSETRALIFSSVLGGGEEQRAGEQTWESDVCWGDGERGPFLLNTRIIKKVGKFWVNVRVKTEDQIPNRQRECERAEAEVLPLIQVFLNDEKRS